MNEDIVVYSLEDFAGIGNKSPQKRRHELFKPVVEYTKEGIYVASYTSAMEASEITGLAAPTIRGVCSGRVLCTNEEHGNKIFLYRGDDIAKRMNIIQEKQYKYIINHHVSKIKQVCEYTLGGRLLYKYSAVKDAALANNITTYMVYSCCKGKRLFVENRIFLFPDGDIKQRVKEVKAELYRLSKKRPKYREVDEYSPDGKFVKAYPSASAASRELGIHVSDITRCCNGYDGYGYNKYMTKGRIFLWIGDSISERLEDIKQANLNKNKTK
jgi:hypothetical protein